MHMLIFFFFYVNTSDIVSNLITSVPTLLLGKTKRKRKNVCIKNRMNEEWGAA
jgi:hypothetical protein